MILLVLLGLVSLAAIVGTIVTVARDGYRPVRTDRTRLPAPQKPAPPAQDGAGAPAETPPTTTLRVQRGWL